MQKVQSLVVAPLHISSSNSVQYAAVAPNKLAVDLAAVGVVFRYKKTQTGYTD